MSSRSTWLWCRPDLPDCDIIQLCLNGLRPGLPDCDAIQVYPGLPDCDAIQVYPVYLAVASSRSAQVYLTMTSFRSTWMWRHPGPPRSAWLWHPALWESVSIRIGRLKDLMPVSFLEVRFSDCVFFPNMERLGADFAEWNEPDHREDRHCMVSLMCGAKTLCWKTEENGGCQGPVWEGWVM